MQHLSGLKDKWLAAIAGAGALDQLENLRVEALGKKGEVTNLMKTLGSLSPEERKNAGQSLNQLKDALTEAIEARKSALQDEALNQRLKTETLDMTLPARPEPEGRIHPISQTIDEIVAIFGEMGFAVAEGPDIEDDFHNFTALNIPPDHPARQMHDTFYLPERRARRQRDGAAHPHLAGADPHDAGARSRRSASSCPGRTYRSDHDTTHTPMFHQVEGLVIDATTHMGHLKGCLIDFCAPSSASTICRCASARASSRSPSRRPRSISAASRAGGELKLGPGRATGWRSSAAAWCTRRCWRIAASIPPSTRASPSAWGSSASRC